MVFSSFTFLLLFLPLCILLYFIVPQQLRSVRNAVLLLLSLIFYFFGEPKGIFPILFIILLSYVSALLIAHGKSNTVKKAWLAVSVIGSLGILCFYKYSGLAISTVNSLFRTSLPLPDIIMPIGISFFTFQSMSYVIDVYRGNASAQKNPAYVALYVVMFPQLIAGPIVRYHTVAEAIQKREESLDDVFAGMRRFLIGLAKKVLLANAFGTVSETIFELTGRSALLAWVGAIFFALQIFYDFCGYSDMAIGLGRIFGFRFPENFDYPYISKSITEFWQRWHISLGTWFRDYLYIPLGGNRRGLPRQILNLLIVWALTGFWHGAGWSFEASYPDYLNNDHDRTEDTLSALMPMLENQQIDTMFLKDTILKSTEPLTALYSAVDHHFTLKGANLCVRAIIDHLNANGVWIPQVVEGRIAFSPLSNPLLGSYNSNLLYSGTEIKDHLLTYSLSHEVPYERWDNGIRTDAPIIRLPQTKSEFVQYNAYMCGDAAETVIKTNRPELKKVLIVGDSFTNAMETILYLSFDEMRSLDYRYYTEKTLTEYIAEYQPDIVLIARDTSVCLGTDGNGNLQ